MPFAKRKSGRGPLQRLKDQRRSVALAGLAVGAVLGAAVFRRKRRGEEAEFGSSLPPEPVPPVARPEAGPPPAVEVPPPATESDVVDEAVAINAPDTINAPEAINAPKVEQTSTTNEPTTGELSTEEASILAVLAQSGRTDDDRTAMAVAGSLHRETAEVTTVLRKLGNEGVVSGELYTASGDKIWAVTERGVRRLGAQS